MPIISGSLRLKRGSMVFYSGDKDGRPRWVIEWQESNGNGCYWIVDATGGAATATDQELSNYPFIKPKA